MCAITERQPEYAEVDRGDGTIARFQVLRPGGAIAADVEGVAELRWPVPEYLEVVHRSGERSIFRGADVRMERYAPESEGEP